uniref:EGF-like domain-containing protein n=1 Tax=Strongyloides papillosus TaxID=174720 RepID=A0A0N5BGW3_STREA
MQDYETINYKVTINYCIKHSKKYGMVNEKNLKDGLNMISKRTCIEFVRKPSCEEKKKTCIKKCSSKRPKKCGKKSGKKPKRKCIEICTVWNKTDECECPTGFTGKKCEWPEQSDHGCPKSFEIVSNTSYTTLLFKGKKNCTVVLEAIKNYKIYILMEQLICKRILPCFEGTCLQLKFQADKALTGYCICGNDDGRWFTTHNNKAVIKYSGLDDSHFARVKYYLGPYYY